MLEVFPQERGTTRPAKDCAACCFFPLVELESRKLRLLCMLTGEKRPIAGMAGCNFIQGQWSQIDAILLAKSRLFSDTSDPNQMKPGSSFSRNGEIVAKTKIALVDFSANLPIYHTKLKAEKAIRRSGTREGRRLI